jgi:hypothetical protein
MAMGEPRRPPPAVWKPPQRGVIVALALILCVVLLIRFFHKRAYISDPPPPRPARFDELADKLDPNVATWQELAVLPQIGEKRARGLVAYREDYLARGHAPVAFMRAEDLLRVDGFGVAMVATLRPYLTFATTRPASNPATTNPATNLATNPTIQPRRLQRASTREAPVQRR